MPQRWIRPHSLFSNTSTDMWLILMWHAVAVWELTWMSFSYVTVVLNTAAQLLPAGQSWRFILAVEVRWIADFLMLKTALFSFRVEKSSAPRAGWGICLQGSVSLLKVLLLESIGLPFCASQVWWCMGCEPSLILSTWLNLPNGIMYKPAADNNFCCIVKYLAVCNFISWPSGHLCTSHWVEYRLGAKMLFPSASQPRFPHYPSLVFRGSEADKANLWQKHLAILMFALISFTTASCADVWVL